MAGLRKKKTTSRAQSVVGAWGDLGRRGQALSDVLGGSPSPRKRRRR